MLKILIIFCFVLSSFNSLAQKQDSCKFYDKYIGLGDGIMQSKKIGKFDSAVKYYNTAMLDCPEKAKEARIKIKVVFDSINNLKDQADAALIYAKLQKEKAEKQETIAINAKEAAENEKKISYKNTLANAPYKYIRLIRDGPIEENAIKGKYFDTLLLAYSNHMDTLQQKLDTFPEVKNDYDKLREYLYYNNDLYEKIFYNLAAYHKENVLVKRVEKDKLDPFNNQYFTDGISISEDSLAIYNANPASQKCTSFALGAGKQQKIFCGTDDNYIVVFNTGDKGKLDTIAMGATITALDFDETEQIIFFGTSGGDIGFINYNADKKNQPVYSTENFLIGSKITAVDFFRHQDSIYLLAAGFGGKGVVYKMGKHYLIPGQNFFGNVLPDPTKDFGDILHARFDENENGVIMKTEKDKKYQYWYWDPFTLSALKKYKEFWNPVPPVFMDDTNFYKSK